MLCRRSWRAVQQVGYSYAEVTDCSVAVRLVLCRRSTGAASQVIACSAAGRLFWGGPATLYALQQRFPSPVPSKESDLRHQRGRPATPDGEPALPEWETCDTRWETSIARGETCDKKCFPFARLPRAPPLPLSHPAPASRSLPAPVLGASHSQLPRSRSPPPLPPPPPFPPSVEKSPHSPFLRSHSPPPSSLPAPASPSSPLPHPRKRFRNPAQYFNILTLVFWWQSIYICDI